MVVRVRLAPKVQPALYSGGTYNLVSALPRVAAPHPQTPAEGVSEDDERADKSMILGSYALVFAAWLVSMAITWAVDTNPFSAVGAARTVAQGLTIFAVFYVAAQAIERLLEPLTTRLLPTDEAKAAAGEAKDQAALTQGAADTALKATDAAALQVAQNDADQTTYTVAEENSTRLVTEAQNALTTWANTVAALLKQKANRRVVFWAICTAIGITVAAVLKLYLLSVVGIAAPARTLDVLATGLIIGSGTQPLHDLVTLISAKSTTAKADAESKQTTA